MTNRLAARLAERWGLALPAARVRERLSAYVYGNILVLSAVVVLEPEQVGRGWGVVAVLATTLTTWAAHVLADAVGSGFRAPGEEHALTDGRRAHLAHELRDAVPILSSGSAPAVVLLLGWAGVLDADAAVLLAAAVVVLRLAGTGVLVGRLSGSPPSPRQAWAGVGVATVAAVVVVAKVVLLH